MALTKTEKAMYENLNNASTYHIAENQKLALAQMAAWCFTDDHEANHINADGILLRVLRQHGYDTLADLYETVDPKWYA